MTERELIDAYKRYLRLELNLTENSIQAYLGDVEKLFAYMKGGNIKLEDVTYTTLQHFLAQLYDLGISPRSIARVISGIKSFYRFLILEEYVEIDPSELLETPKIGLHLPTVLSVEEIDLIIESIDMTKDEGLRNKAIIEVLYSCGLRVSELCHLRLRDVHPEEGFIQVWGKGRKERLVPISTSALEAINKYLSSDKRPVPKPGETEYIFLSRRGKAISRITVFCLIKDLAILAGITKDISPHTFRHSFATHLLEGGANLQAIRIMLGHEDIGTTEIYTHIDKTQLRRDILKYHPRNSAYYRSLQEEEE